MEASISLGGEYASVEQHPINRDGQYQWIWYVFLTDVHQF